MANLFLWVIEFFFMETCVAVETLNRKILTSVTLVPAARWTPKRAWALWKGE